MTSFLQDIALGLHNELYIIDGRRIRFVQSDGTISTLSGSLNLPNVPAFNGGLQISAAEAQWQWPTYVTINPIDGSLTIVDSGEIMKVSGGKVFPMGIHSEDYFDYEIVEYKSSGYLMVVAQNSQSGNYTMIEVDMFGHAKIVLENLEEIIAFSVMGPEDVIIR